MVFRRVRVFSFEIGQKHSVFETVVCSTGPQLSNKPMQRLPKCKLNRYSGKVVREYFDAKMERRLLGSGTKFLSTIFLEVAWDFRVLLYKGGMDDYLTEECSPDEVR